MQPKSSGSWVQLVIFTAFLFLLVAIPYTIYLKSSNNKSNITIENLPTPVISKKIPTLTPPPSSTTTTCVIEPANYQPDPSASKSGYVIANGKNQVCFPASLPPFPFTWQSAKDFVNGFSIDIPSNWTEKDIKTDDSTLHGFFSEIPTATSSADIAYGVYSQDPYATNSAFLKESRIISTKTATVYTNEQRFIAAVIPLSKGSFVLQASLSDAAFYAFEHMLDSFK